MHPQSVRSAYSLLVAAAGEHKEAVAQETVTRKLRDVLLTGEERGKAELERRQKIHRRLCKLQGLRRFPGEPREPIVDVGGHRDGIEGFLVGDYGGGGGKSGILGAVF